MPRKLPPDRELLELIKSHSYQQVADLYGVSYSGVAQALSKARKNLGLARKRLPQGAALLALLESESMSQVALRYGVQVSAVSEARRRAVRDLEPVANPDDTPPRKELDDALRRWGIDGVAEEYDVSTERVCAWMRALEI